MRAKVRVILMLIRVRARVITLIRVSKTSFSTWRLISCIATFSIRSVLLFKLLYRHRHGAKGVISSTLDTLLCSVVVVHVCRDLHCLSEYRCIVYPGISFIVAFIGSFHNSILIAHVY